jgi:hypothetical protein
MLLYSILPDTAVGMGVPGAQPCSPTKPSFEWVLYPPPEPLTEISSQEKEFQKWEISNLRLSFFFCKGSCEKF